jgi:hypothetical protein
VFSGGGAFGDRPAAQARGRDGRRFVGHVVGAGVGPGRSDLVDPASFLLSGPGLDPKTWDLCAARESKAQLERVCGSSGGPGCCTLLLYCRALLFEFGF